MTIHSFEGDPQYLARRYMWLCCIQALVFCVFVGAVVFLIGAVNSNFQLQAITDHLWMAIPILLLLLAFAAAGARAKKYSLNQQYLSFYSGVLFKKVTLQPFTRLQHMEITRGPLERVFGLATLKLFSAGGAQHTLAIPGLHLAAAERLRTTILGSKGLRDEQ